MKKSNQPLGNNFVPKNSFETIFNADGKYYFQFNDAEGEPLLFSKGYSSAKTCADGIKTAIRLASAKERYDLKEAKKGAHFFILKSSNRKEIARSRMFDSLDKLELQLPLLQNMDQNVPQYGIQDHAAVTKKPVSVKKKTPTKAKKENPAEAKARKPSLIEDADKMPRYKFSTIFYPDSNIWKLRSDFSEASTKLKSLDGMKMAKFLKAQLPAKIRKTIQLETPVQPVAQKNQVAAEVVVKAISKVPAKKEAPAMPAPEHIELLIKTQEGKRTNRFAKVGSLATIELSPKTNEGLQSLVFEGIVTAKSLSTKQTSIIGGVKNQNLVNGQLEIPIYAGNSLVKGLYRIQVDASGGEKGVEVRHYHCSELVKLI